MHWVTILGLVLIFIGSFLTYLGNTFQNNVVSTEIKDKIQDTNNKIEALRKEPKINEEAVDKIDNEFSKWATEFIKNKDSQKLHFEKQSIEMKANDLNISKEWLPFYSFFFEVLKNLLDAYNKTSNNQVMYEIPQLPKYLFSEEISKYIVKIEFSKKVVWNISLRFFGSESTPIIDITVQNNTKIIGNLSIAPFVISRDKITIIRNNKNIFITDELKDEYDIADYKSSLKIILKTIVEYQLALID